MIDASFLSCRKWTGSTPASATESKDAFPSVIPLSTGRTGQIGLILPMSGASLRTVMTDSSIPDMMAEAHRGQWTDQQLAAKAVELAESILRQSNSGMRGTEKRQAQQMERMMNDPAGKAFTLALADRVFRPSSPARGAELFRYLLDGYGVPRYLSAADRFAMKMGGRFSDQFPGVVMPMITSQLRKESSNVILPAEDGKLRSHLRRRRKAGIRMNINQLGEAILGESEAHHRLQQVVDRLTDKDCDYISVKISAIFSQIHLVAFEETVKLIQERLRILYRAAITNAVTLPDGSRKPKFVNLDMEEYRDLHLTAEAFKRTLMEDEFMHLEAGIVLQAYLPDSWEEQMKLCAWAKERVEQGGARIKIRLVKGANLAMEKVEASMHGWAQAPYGTKAQVDANYKRMLHYGCMPDNARYVQFGVASHNLFDLCYAMLLREREGVRDQVEFEMLEGMANHQARVIRQAADGLLLYAPVVLKEDFHSAIAYLVRRLDENTSEENFLHDLFGMTPGSRSWEVQKKRFLKACQEKDEVKYGPNRTQNRAADPIQPSHYRDAFANERDTDWSLRQNAEWINGLIAAEKEKSGEEIPLVIDGEEITTNLWGVGRDPSRHNEVSYKFAYADFEQVEHALDTADRARSSWASKSIGERAEILHRAAQELSRIRGEAIAAMVRDAGKAPTEADVEVSEAIDFCRYYAEGLDRDGMNDGVEMSPLGTICVMSPWNFPFAIPTGGVAAALMAGNAVVFKPSELAVYTAWQIAQAFWRAGVPKNVLQFVPMPRNEISRKFLMDRRLNGVIMTGSYRTGKMLRELRPDLHVLAETSGKDAMIITATADPDQAVKDLVKSAFGHSGQKCSAASVAIVEASVYDNPAFLRQLKDAAASLKVGGSWEVNSVVTPLIREPEGNLLRALTQLEPGEEWLLKPEPSEDNPCLWSPGIRLGVKPGSWFHQTECFGPVLGIIRAENLEEAIDIQNDSEFGLTGGLQSLDEREIALWKTKVQVGNAYINRVITGAIVRRQPFGGWNHSSMGPGAKAGGPNYLTMLGSWEEKALPQKLRTPGERISGLVEKLCSELPDCAKRIRSAAGSQAKWWMEEFGVEHDPSHIYGENNTFRYIPVKGILARVENMSDDDVAILLLGAKLCGVLLHLSVGEERPWIRKMNGYYASLTVETETELIGRMPEAIQGVRFLRGTDVSEALANAARACDAEVLDRPVFSNGRLELLGYFREQSVSETVHRYGNLIPPPGSFKTDSV